MVADGHGSSGKGANHAPGTVGPTEDFCLYPTTGGKRFIESEAQLEKRSAGLCF